MAVKLVEAAMEDLERAKDALAALELKVRQATCPGVNSS